MGLASKNTLQIIGNAATRDTPIVPLTFWCKDSTSESDQCCFWHYIFHPYGGPERDGIYHPCYDYEQQILDKMQMEPLEEDRTNPLQVVFSLQSNWIRTYRVYTIMDSMEVINRCLVEW